MIVSLGFCGHVAYGSVRSVQLFRSDSEGRLRVGLLRHLHSVTSHHHVRNSVDWCGQQGYKIQWENEQSKPEEGRLRKQSTD